MLEEDQSLTYLQFKLMNDLEKNPKLWTKKDFEVIEQMTE